MKIRGLSKFQNAVIFLILQKALGVAIHLYPNGHP